MKAVILESYVMEEGDLDWSGVKALIPDTTSYVRTAYEEIAPRIGGAEVVFLNKCRMDEAVLAQCPNLKFVGIIATGTDNLDLEACRRHGVAVANVPGYSTYSVAQMTFSLLLAICQCAERYNRAVKDGCWQLDIPASYGLLPQVELFGKTFGVYGYGSIGRQTARIAKAFGMRVLVCTRTVRPEYSADGVEFVEFDTLLRESDVLSLHCPATSKTRGLISADALARMKPGAILLNTARGALVDEEAVAAALRSGLLGFYGADAFGTEPLPQESPLRKEPHAILTPHIAWTTKEALQNLMDITTRNLRTFLDGNGGGGAALAGRPGCLEAPCAHPLPVDGQAARRHLHPWRQDLSGRPARLCAGRGAHPAPRRGRHHRAGAAVRRRHQGPALPL